MQINAVVLLGRRVITQSEIKLEKYEKSISSVPAQCEQKSIRQNYSFGDVLQLSNTRCTGKQ